MAVSEFRKALQNRVINNWMVDTKLGDTSDSSVVNVLVNPAAVYRESEQSAQKTSFIITQQTIKELLAQFKNVPMDSENSDILSAQLFKKFGEKYSGVRVGRRTIKLDKNLPAIYFPHISFGAITDLVNNIVGLKSGELAEYFEKGHVVGLATELLRETKSNIAQLNTSGYFGKNVIVDQLDKIIKYYEKLDLQSANIQPYDSVQIYGKYVKRATNRNPAQAKYLVELQPKIKNQQSKLEVQSTLASFRTLFTKSNITEKQILRLLNNLKKRVSDPEYQKNLDYLITTPSSPPLTNMLEDLITSTILGKPFDKTYSGSNIYIEEKQVPRIDMQPLKKYIKSQIVEAKKAKNAVKTRQTRTKTISSTNLVQLKTLLDNLLVKQIIKNMGTGNRKDVLNYRSGRFAESVKVERLSESRQGMITAFYSYMKNPYATFSTGGRQELPRTRDPKTLIARSIREVAQTLVTNRLRAVNV